LHYYSASNIRTNDDGELEIISEATDTEIIGFDDQKMENTRVTKHFRSGMLQSWNKFCFTGGIIEAEVQLPGYAEIGGLWPALWLLGNLARHTYVGSSTHVWPFTAHECNALTKYSQKLTGCNARAHYDLAPGFGRGAPEIDVFEMQPGPIRANEGQYLQSFVGQPFMSASYQFAPGKVNRPGTGWWPYPGQWYDGVHIGNETCLNIVFYGVYNSFFGDTSPRQAYWSDALSYNRQLTASHFKERHKYRLEWGVPDSISEDEGESHTGFNSGYLNWYLDDQLVMAVNGSIIEAPGYGATISSEPMSIILNTAISKQWGFPNKPDWCPGKVYDCNSKDGSEKCGFDPFFCEMMQRKPKLKVNYIRVYQDKSDPKQKVGCSTPERPTRKYIIANQNKFKLDTDILPLKPIQVGRGVCHPESSNSSIDRCGGPARGTCTAGFVCECKAGWTGPHCLAAAGRDPIIWDHPDSIHDLGLDAPAFIPRPLVIGLVLMFSMLLFVVSSGRRANEGWKSIPEIKTDYERDLNCDASEN